ncbi:MAG TPA: SCO family protein [Candidatus Aquilonibacter sp.]|nr:SCO family protein [Candidatus Aquilonibacter sp.]
MVVIHGLVVGVDGSHHQAAIRHDAYNGMPAMTMTFAIDPNGAQPKAGDRISGLLDDATDPPTLNVITDVAPQGAQTPQPYVPVLRPGDTVDDATFVDERGRARTWRDFRGHPTVVSFIYTRCRDARMCPLVSAKFGRLQQLVPRNARLIEFTLDPTYDTPAVLARYGALFDQRDPPWTLATGDPSTMLAISKSFGVGIPSRTATTIVHTEAVGILNADGTVRTIVFGNEWRPSEIADEVRVADGFRGPPLAAALLDLRSFLGAAAHACGLVDSDNRFRPAMVAVDVAGALIFIGAAFALLRSLRQNDTAQRAPRSRRKST